MKLVNCPVCRKKFLKEGLKNHIINKGKSELWNQLKRQPHREYYLKHCIFVKGRKQTLKTLTFYKIK